MDNRKKIVKEIEPLDEGELTIDLKFLYHNRSDTVDLFIEEAIPVMKYHINKVMVEYQERLMETLTNSLRGEIAHIIVNTRRATVYDDKRTLPDTSKTEDSPKDETHAW